MSPTGINAPARRRRARDGSRFLPTDIDGAVLWLRADLGITLNGSDVAAWADQSGEGNDAIQATGSQQPEFVSGPLPALDFQGMELMTASLSPAADMPFTAMAVYRTADAASDARRALDSTTGNWLIGPYTAKYQVFAGAFSSGPTTVADRVVWHMVTQESGSLLNYVDGVQDGSSATTGVDIGSGVAIGNVETGSQPLDDLLYEVVLYERIVTADEIASLETYFAARYGL